MQGVQTTTLDGPRRCFLCFPEISLGTFFSGSVEPILAPDPRLSSPHVQVSGKVDFFDNWTVQSSRATGMLRSCWSQCLDVAASNPSPPLSASASLHSIIDAMKANTAPTSDPHCPIAVMFSPNGILRSPINNHSIKTTWARPRPTQSGVPNIAQNIMLFELLRRWRGVNPKFALKASRDC